MPKRIRRNLSSRQEAGLLKRHHREKIPVSNPCDESKLSPSVLYTWRR